MERIKTALTMFSISLFAFSAAFPQKPGRRRITAGSTAASTLPCTLNGAYRIDVVESDKLYSAVKDAASTIPFGEQQRFFMDLSTRLTPPDMLAIECQGNRVTVGSSRAPRVTYLADGRTRRERTAGGTFVNSRVELTRDTLTFVSTGTAEDSVNVAFRSIEGGRRLGVTRSIYAEQLAEPIVIRSIYDKIAERADWDIYDGRNIAKGIPPDPGRTTSRPAVSRSSSDASAGGRASELRTALAHWLDATSRRDIGGQMDFYSPELKAYYLKRNVPRSAVRAEKDRVFTGVRSVDIRAREPEIIFQENGSIAVMRFVKEYRVSERSRTRAGSVIQELRWRRTVDGWRIYSERDIRVLR